MNNKLNITINLIKTTILYLVFAIFTILVSIVDVEQIGPGKSKIGFSHLNAKFIQMTGVHRALYSVTDLLAVISILFMVGFATFGIYQLLKRKSLFKVDAELYALAVTYIIMIAIYLIFEKVIINYRPVLIDEALEASYPSSHTMLAVTVFVTSAFEFRRLIRSRKIAVPAIIISLVLCIIAVTGRLLCGVHWLTDIIAAVIISSALVMSYRTLTLIIGTILKKLTNK